jgi:hypothetical protein
MKRKSEKEQKKLENDARLLRAWKQFHREERETALLGPHGAVLNELFCMFKNLQHVQPSQLIGFVRAINWAEIDYNTKLAVVHEANSAIVAYREKRGLDPIDDGLPGAPETPFRTIHHIVLAHSPPHGGRSPGTQSGSDQTAIRHQQGSCKDEHTNTVR